MAISKIKPSPPRFNIEGKGTQLSQAGSFKYLGTLLPSDGGCVTEVHVNSRTAQARASFQKLKYKLCNKSVYL